MENQIYSISKETIKERKKMIYTMMVIMSISIVIFSLVISSSDGGINLKVALLIMGISLVIVIIETIIVGKVMIKKISEMKIIFESEMLKRIGGKKEEIIEFKDIKSIRVKRNTKGEILFIILKSVNKTMNIGGFEQMEEVLSLLSSNVTDESIITVKQYKINWNSPIIMGFLMTIIITAIILVIKINENIYEVFNIIVPLGCSVHFLTFKPISKNSGARFRKFEIVCSILLFLIGILLLILKLIEII